MSVSRFNIWSRSLSLGAAAALVFGASACKSGSSASKDDLALAPKDAAMVFGLNLARMRSAPVWKKITDFVGSQPSQKKDYDEMAANCVDFIGPTGPDSVFIAVPSTGSGSKDFEVVVRLKTAIDEAQVMKCATYGARTRATTRSSPPSTAARRSTARRSLPDKDGGVAMLDGKTFVIASGPWMHHAIDLATNKATDSAKTNDVLAGLVKRAKTTDAVWGAGIVPQTSRDQLKGDPTPRADGVLAVGHRLARLRRRLPAPTSTWTPASADDAKKLNELVTSAARRAQEEPAGHDARRRAVPRRREDRGEGRRVPTSSSSTRRSSSTRWSRASHRHARLVREELRWRHGVVACRWAAPAWAPPSVVLAPA